MPNPNLESGNFYHIYNRGINSCNLFDNNENYYYFLKLYDKYISPVAHTYAWVLMPNHFHFLIYLDITGFEDLTGPYNLKPAYQSFSNLFNAYTKAFNKYHNRHGSLFERPFKRKLIDSDEYLRQTVMYIHNNPVHHSFVKHPVEYAWSSYLTCLSEKKSQLKRAEVIQLFKDRENFIHCHKKIESFDKELFL